MKLFRNIYITLSVIVALPATLFAEEINGVIQSSTSTPLAGYLIKSVGGDKIAIAGQDGDFSIDANIGDVLEIYNDTDYISSVKITSATPQIKLSQTHYLESVEMGLYPTIDRERSSAAVDMVTAEQIESNSFTNSSHSVIGKLASVITTQSSGEIFNDDLTFTVRGKSSMNSNTPLILIDGFESSLSYVSDHEIESITVLKDAVSTAMYGMRGANGVILITTKRGRSGAPSYRVGADFSLLKHTNQPDMVNAQQYSSLVNEARYYDGLSPRYTTEQIALQGSDQYLYPDVDWADYMLKSMSQSVSAYAEVSGGSDKIRYYSLFDYVNYNGMFNEDFIDPDYSAQNDGYALNFRTNVTMDLSKSTSLTARLAGKVQNRTTPEEGVSTLYNTLYSTPANRYTILNEDGSYGGNNLYRDNPLGLLQSQGYNEYHYRMLNANLEINHKMDYLTEGLTLNGSATFMSYFLVNEKYRGASFAVSEYAGVDDLGSTIYNSYGQNTVLSYDSRSSSQERVQNFRVGFGYDKSVDQHSIVASLTGEMSERVYENTSEEYLQMAVVGSVNYGYNNKYFVDLVASYDGSNSYAPGNKFGFFPAAGASWIVSREDFMAGSKVVNYLKLRASYGVVGSDAVGNYRRFMYLANYSGSNSHRFGETASSSIYTLEPTTASNPDATWERDYKFNFGVDARLFRDLNVNLDIFHEIRDDILQSVDSWYSGVIGYDPMWINYGKVRNVGFDLTLAYQKRVNDLIIDAGLNMGFAKNKILKTIELESAVNSNVGNPINAVYGYKAIGLYSSDEDVANSPQSELYPVGAGDIKYANLNDDNVINEYDKTYLGNEYPTAHLGFTLGLEYKRIYLSAHLDSQFGYDVMLDDSIVYNPLDGGYDNISMYAAANRWTPERANTATLPRLTTLTNHSNNATNSLYMANGNFLRLRSAEIGYKFDASSLSLGDIKLYARGHNLLMFDSIDGVDADIISGITMPRYITFGVNLEF